VLGACGESNPPAAQATPTSAAASTTAATTATTAVVIKATQAQILSQIDTGIPLYPAANQINLGANFEKTIGQPLVKALGGNTAKIKYRVYATNKAPAWVLQYYEEEFGGLGLLKVTTRKLPQIPNFNLPATGIAYATDDSVSDIKSMGAAVVGPLSSATISQLATLDPAFGTDVKAGDTLVILASGF